MLFSLRIAIVCVPSGRSSPRGERESFVTEYTLRMRNGETTRVEERAHAVQEDGSDARHVHGCIVDASHRSPARHQGIIDPDRMRSLVELQPVALCEFEGRDCIYANTHWSRLTGRSTACALGTQWLESVHPDDRKVVWDHWEEHQFGMAGEETVCNGPDGRFLRPDNTVTWFASKLRCTYDNQGKLASATVILMEVNEKRELKQWQTRLTEILESTSDFVGIATPDRNIVWQNTRLNELRPDLSVPRGASDFAEEHPEWSRELMQNTAIPYAIEHGCWQGEMAIYDAHGNEIPVSQVLIAHKSSDGKLEAISTIMRDIRREKAAERALRESECKYASLAEKAPVAIFRFSDAQNCIYVNDQWSDMTGRPKEAALGTGWMKSVFPGDLDRIQNSLRAFVNDPKRLVGEPHEARQLLADGSTRWVNVHVAKEQDPEGNVTGLVGILSSIDAAKQTEEKLRELNDRLHKVLECSSIGIWEWCWDKQRLDWDEQMFAIYGVDSNTFRGSFDDWTDRLHPDDFERLMTSQRQELREQGITEDEFRIVRPHGETRYIYSKTYTEFDSQGHPFRTTGLNLDITDLRRTELALAESESKFARVEDSVPGMLYRAVVHPDGREELVYANSRSADIYECGAQEAMSNSEILLDRIHPDDRSALKERIAAANTSLIPLICEYRLQLPQKGTRWVQSIAKPTRENDGRVVWDGIVLDQTERITAQIALQEAQSQLERITANVPGLIYRHLFSADGGHRAEYISQKSFEIYGVHHADAMEDVTRLLQWIHPDDLEPLKETVLKSVKERKPLFVEYRLLHPTDGLRWHQSTGMPQRMSNGDTKLDGFVIDVTDQKRAELQLQVTNEELRKATRLKDEFLANMSHELRTPLSAILGMTEGLKDGVFGAVTDKQRDSLGVIQESGSHLLALINDVLDLAKIESGSIELNIERFAVEDACQSAIQFVSQDASKQGVQLRCSIQEDLPPIEADQRRLRQILINLLSNAVKFTPRGGSVRLDVRLIKSNDPVASDRFCFSVEDTGIGIEASNQELLFDPFYQIDSSLSREFEGTGLGLALVKQFTDLHAGSVSVESRQGHGSLFQVLLPLAQKAHAVQEQIRETPEPEPPATGSEQSLQPGTIMLVEDNELVATTTRQYLQASGFHVQLVGNGHEAMTAVENQQSDLILMDVQMPGVSGLDVIRHLRTLPQHASTPVIALTGLAMQDDENRCLAAGANVYMSKPYSMAELISTIGRLLESK